MPRFNPERHARRHEGDLEQLREYYGARPPGRRVRFPRPTPERGGNAAGWMVIGLGVTLTAVAVWAAFAAEAGAQDRHDLTDPGHWYDLSCCSERDCAPIAREHVERGPWGALITLEPGDHPTVKERVQRIFRDPNGGGDATPWRWSQDGDWHACVLPRTQHFICAYGPRGGA